jgi:hypothetical protein
MTDYLQDGELGLMNKSGQFADVQDCLDAVIERGEMLFVVEQDTEDWAEQYAEQKLKKVGVLIPYERFKKLILDNKTWQED